MSDLPERPPAGTPTATRKIFQPQDETPDIVVRNGKLFSVNPTEPKQRAEFAIEEPITLTFDQRPILNAAAPFRENKDLDGFIKCFENSTMDIKTIGNHVFVTIQPGE